MIALLLPSYRSFRDLFYTLWATPLSPECKFIVTANYPDCQLRLFEFLFSKRAVFIDERKYGKGGMIKAYNLAFDYARSLGATHCALWADDIMPQKRDWAATMRHDFIEPGLDFGIFSSDECHKHRFGWNFFGGVPNAHFFVAKTALLGDYFLNPALKAYVGDYEVCYRLGQKGVPFTLLPIRLNHYPRVDPTRKMNTKHYAGDLEVFNRLYPELKGLMDDVVLKGDYSTNGRYVIDDGSVRSTREALPFVTYEELMHSDVAR